MRKQAKKIKPLPRGEVSAQELKEAFIFVLKRVKSRQPRSLPVNVKAKPLTEMMTFLSNQLASKPSISFFACADKMTNIWDVIGLFLAMLELGKKRKIRIRQRRSFGDLSLERINHGK